jgi:spermidine/putrescine transport system substrate-binding protein
MDDDVDRMLERKVGRGDFLKLAAAAACGGGLLAACGGEEEEGMQGPTNGAAPKRPPIAEESGDLLIFEWSGYEVRPLWKPYAQEFPDKKPKFSFLTGTPQAFARMRAGFEPDLVHPCNAYVQNFVNADLVQPFDTSLISNFDDLNVAMVATGRVDDKQYYIPTDWGLNAPMYRADKIDPQEESWNILYDERYAGKISWHDHTDNLVINAWVQGFPNPYDMTDDELEAVKNDLIEKKKIVRNIFSSETELAQDFAAGNTWIGYASAQGWSIAKDAELDAVHMDPQEGRQAYSCGFLLGKDTENYHHAHEYVDAWASVESAEWLITEYSLGHTNTKLDISKVDPTIAEAYKLADPVALQEANFDQFIPRLDVYGRIWTEVKAA